MHKKLTTLQHNPLKGKPYKDWLNIFIAPNVY